MKIFLLLLLSVAAHAESLGPPPADTRSIEVRAKEVRDSVASEGEETAILPDGGGDTFSTGYGYSDLDASLNDNLFLGEKVGNLYKNPYLPESYNMADDTNPFLSTKESIQDTNPYSGYLRNEEQYAYRDNVFLESVDVASPSGPSLFNEYQALENRFWSGKPNGPKN